MTKVTVSKSPTARRLTEKATRIERRRQAAQDFIRQWAAASNPERRKLASSLSRRNAAFLAMVVSESRRFSPSTGGSGIVIAECLAFEFWNDGPFTGMTAKQTDEVSDENDQVHIP